MTDKEFDFEKEFEEAKEKTAEKLDEVAEKGGEIAEKVRESAENAAEKAKDFVKDAFPDEPCDCGCCDDACCCDDDCDCGCDCDCDCDAYDDSAFSAFDDEYHTDSFKKGVQDKIRALKKSASKVKKSYFIIAGCIGAIVALGTVITILIIRKNEEEKELSVFEKLLKNGKILFEK